MLIRLEVTEKLAAINNDIEHLESILRELKEAVVVCDQNARILLYNTAAKQLFEYSEVLGLGQSLYGICARAPIEHSLKVIKNRDLNIKSAVQDENDIRFVCATVNESLLLNCRISRIKPKENQASVYIFTFEDITRQLSEMKRHGDLFENIVKKLRSPLTNLTAAVENLKNFPKMTPEIRTEFEEVIFRESAELACNFESIVHESSKFSNIQWPLADVYSADLIGALVRKFDREQDINVTMTGVPLWLQADSFSLMLILERLVLFVHKKCDVQDVDMEVLLGDRRVYIDIVWQGKPILEASIDGMLQKLLPYTIAGMTIADVLERHDSEIWSQKHHRDGHSLLRIPVPDSPRQWEVSQQKIAERPVFYDFSLVKDRQNLGEIADQPLSSLNYVVFDTETTGLRPSQGDEILAIAAVRIVNGRILSGEKFERLVKPQLPIPESSVPFLSVTEEMIQDEYPIQIVLPQFKSFIGDAVLVAHNGIFDMTFFQLMDDKSDVSFTNPLLDTLLLSNLLKNDRNDHTLESIGQSLGVEITSSLSVMGDCFAVAQIFLKIMKLLEKKGISTIGEVIAASEKMVEEKKLLI